MLVLASALALIMATSYAAEPAGAAKSPSPGEEKGKAGMAGPERPQALTAESILEKFDADKDKELSKDEFAKFMEDMFGQADRSANGKLDAGELTGLMMRLAPRPAFGPSGPGGPGGPSAMGFFMSFDKNGDKKISKDEMPERMQERFDQMDTNKDGFIDETEMASLQGRFGQRPGGEAGRPGGQGRQGMGAGKGQGPGGAAGKAGAGKAGPADDEGGEE